jgi:hypothetical protein
MKTGIGLILLSLLLCFGAVEARITIPAKKGDIEKIFPPAFVEKAIGLPILKVESSVNQLGALHCYYYIKAQIGIPQFIQINYRVSFPFERLKYNFYKAKIRIAADPSIKLNHLISYNLDRIHTIHLALGKSRYYVIRNNARESVDDNKLMALAAMISEELSGKKK